MNNFKYESPEISLLVLDEMDVIATSGETPDLGGNGDDSILDW